MEYFTWNPVESPLKFSRFSAWNSMRYETCAAILQYRQLWAYIIFGWSRSCCWVADGSLLSRLFLCCVANDYRSVCSSKFEATVRENMVLLIKRRRYIRLSSDLMKMKTMTTTSWILSVMLFLLHNQHGSLSLIVHVYILQSFNFVVCIVYTTVTKQTVL